MKPDLKLYQIDNLRLLKSSQLFNQNLTIIQRGYHAYVVDNNYVISYH